MCWKPFLAHTAIHRHSKANTNQNQVNKHHVSHHIMLPQDFKTHSKNNTKDKLQQLTKIKEKSKKNVNER
ncbi:hypothetical protein LHK_01132 [Laribacter hongkongensis HLHK9]|uniref:Uncharacterized protein n=1 Tax=Laribacter hongkongensis (strain HLHK9) TaxID=557598 RepID=C1D6L6_LARHH|nr:hypothetical protein LHK_01132 [Laribacter hongkongensis HLHK9]